MQQRHKMSTTPVSSTKATADPREKTQKSNSKSGILDNLLLLLVAYRLLNAFTVRTFFQPDEYYQALEPAWWLAFGEDSGAWITWEWREHLRSALHPALFAATYHLANSVAGFLGLSLPVRSQLLLAAPKILQAPIAALGDYYTYKLAAQIYGPDSYPAWATIWLTVGSAWNWFVSTRTFSNCLETTLTIIALYHWPFQWALGADEVGFQVHENALHVRQENPRVHGRPEEEKKITGPDETTRLRSSILAASLAVILRPTNAIIWLTLTIATFGRAMWQRGMHGEIGAFIREGLFCGTTVLALSSVIDRLFYGVWTFPLWHFFRVNILQSMAVFYGNNNWHYYLSQGYPLLLTIAIVPAAIGLYSSLATRNEPIIVSIQSRLILHRLAFISLIVPAVLSVLSHKEVRFIYPILPALHILAALPTCRAFGFADIVGKPRFVSSRRPGASIGLVAAVSINILIALYTSLLHNRGCITVTDFLRTEFESYYVSPKHFHPVGARDRFPAYGRNLTFAALMPCHSIPWRSHLQYPPTNTSNGISGWALTCEPPLNLNATQKASYLDEADIFYADPAVWLKTHMPRDVPEGSPKPGVYAKREDRKHWSNPNPQMGVFLNQGEGAQSPNYGGIGSLSRGQKAKSVKRAWPDYVIFFGQLEPFMRTYLENSAYRSCARLFNSHAHDDWRRKGEVVVYCLHSDREVRRRGG